MSLQQFDKERFAAQTEDAKVAIRDLLIAQPGPWRVRELMTTVRSVTGIPMDPISEAFFALKDEGSIFPSEGYRVVGTPAIPPPQPPSLAAI